MSKCTLQETPYLFKTLDFCFFHAFLISNGTDVFAITGMRTDLEFIGLEDNEQELVSEETEAVEEDDMDFAMF